ncbi:MAG: hypothetical protein U0527_02845 [Candidatus Eisenbacteria bacterium]
MESRKQGLKVVQGPFRMVVGLSVVVAVSLAATAQASSYHGRYLPVPQIIDNDTRVDVNNVDMYVTNHGSIAYDLGNSASGLFFPKGTTKTAVYAAGLWVGAKIRGHEGDGPQVTVGEYSQEYAAGVINPDGTPASEADSRYRVYKIDRGVTDSEDYLNWPAADGAPVDAQGNPEVIGDQTLWAVYNDADASKHTNDAGNSNPLGLEVQQTVFGFARQEPLGNMVFVKWKFINKGQNTLDSTFVSVWSDPDLGGAGDDLVGCDTTLSVGYVYNATNEDELYGSAPPAVGFDFFQGPIVPSPGDTASVSGHLVPGYKNLPMTSFDKYINGTDPSSPTESYNYMKGLLPDGSAYVNPSSGQATKFFHSGDPVAGTGDLDDNPSDRRLMLSSGPFTMAPGDTQEVVVAIIVAQGGDRLSSISLLKQYDVQAQAVFDINFRIPSPPPRPTVFARALDREVELVWTAGADGDVQVSQELDQEFHFEGYNVWQGESVAGPWKRIATYDVDNDVALIYSDVFDVTIGGSQKLIVAAGTNSGVVHSLKLDSDKLLGGPLVNYHEYFYAVTAYSYETRHDAPYSVGPNQVGIQTEVLENPRVPVTVLPKSNSGVLSVTAAQSGGLGHGEVEAAVVDPAGVTGDSYTLTYAGNADPETQSGHPVVYNIKNNRTNQTVLANGKSLIDDFGESPFEGLLSKVYYEPEYLMLNDSTALIVETKGPGGSTIPADGPGVPGNLIWNDLNSTGDWKMRANGGDFGFGRFTRNGGDEANLILGYNIEIRFDGRADNFGVWAFDNGAVGPVPFGVYLVSAVGNYEERLIPNLFSAGGTEGVYDYADETTDDAGVPITDAVYAYAGADYAAFAADAADGTLEPSTDTGSTEMFARQIFASPGKVIPAQGTVVRIYANGPQSGETWSFSTATSAAGLVRVIDDDMDKIHAVPNPYFNQSAYELTQFDRVIRFINLPNAECTVRIFNLAGDLVRTLEKTDKSVSFLRWDLQTDKGFPVASGIYVYHIDAKGVGTKTGKLAVFVEKERLNRF